MSCVDSRLNSKIARFNAQASNHQQQQALNPFSNDSVASTKKHQFSKEEYGRPVKGSLSESRGFKATASICKEILELCEVINEYGAPLFSKREKPDDKRKVISFGELFNLYTLISNKLVGVLLRARKHHIVDFEGECLFQRRDDHVPIILMKPIEDIRQEFHGKIDTALEAVRTNEERRSQERMLDEPEQRQN